MTNQKVRARILSSVTMLTEPEIPAGCLGQGLHFTSNGETEYPRFQYDMKHGQLLPVMKDILNLRPVHWSDLRILEWLTRPHLDFGCQPCDALVDQPGDVVTAFKREIEPPMHG